MHTLEESGYTRDSTGRYSLIGSTPFASGMFEHCGKEIPRAWTWAPEWLDEVEPNKRPMTRDEMVDFAISDSRIRVRFSNHKKKWRLAGWFDYMMMAPEYEYCIRENGEYGPAMQFEVEDDES